VDVIQVRRRARRGWEKRFLAAIRNGGSVRAACEAAGVDRTTPYLRAKRDAQFAAEWAAASEDAIDRLEGHAWQLALAGDARMTMFLLKALRRRVYGDALEVRIDPRPAAERIATSLGLSTDELLGAAERLAQELDR